MLADRFPDDRERGNAMGVALGGLALGVLGKHGCSSMQISTFMSEKDMIRYEFHSYNQIYVTFNYREKNYVYVPVFP